MFAVCVDLRIKPGQMAAFLPLMIANAEASLRDEPGCHQFDVCRVDADPDLVVLYELYTDADAFAAHLAAPHFQSFDVATAEMVAEKAVRTGPRLVPAQAGA